MKRISQNILLFTVITNVSDIIIVVHYTPQRS